MNFTSAPINIFILTAGEMAMWNVKEVTQSDKPTETICQQLHSIEQLYWTASLFWFTLSGLVAAKKSQTFHQESPDTELNTEWL